MNYCVTLIRWNSVGLFHLFYCTLNRVMRNVINIARNHQPSTHQHSAWMTNSTIIHCYTTLHACEDSLLFLSLVTYLLHWTGTAHAHCVSWLSCKVPVYTATNQRRFSADYAWIILAWLSTGCMRLSNSVCAQYRYTDITCMEYMRNRNCIIHIQLYLLFHWTTAT